MTQPTEPRGAATEDGGTDAGMARLWLCPSCHFAVGFIDDENNLVIWRPEGSITLRSGVFVCACGEVIHWIEAVKPLPF